EKAPQASRPARERPALLSRSSDRCPDEPERTPHEDLQTVQVQATDLGLGGAWSTPTGLVPPAQGSR
ncbi:hypothetical protein HPG69_015385, partial [Diceros bicornis minor]